MGPPAADDDVEGQQTLLPAANGRSQVAKARSRAHKLVEGQIDTWFEYSLLCVIFVNVLALILSTLVVEKDCFGSECQRLGEKYVAVFEAIEWVSVTIFTIEYFMRLWASWENPWVRAKGPVWGRVRYAFSFYMILDLVSIAPNWISLGSAALAPFTDLEFFESPDFTTAARILRLVRIFKTDKYLNAFGLLGSVLYDNGVLLLATSFYSALVWVIASTLLYFTERNNAKMDTHFQSIPQAMFPTLLMLTGEFPLADFTPIGQVIAGFVAVVAVAIFAVPTSVLGSGFIQAVQRSTGRDFSVDTD